MNHIQLFILVTFIGFSHQLTVKEIAKDLKTCYHKDNSKLRECLTDYFNQSIPLLSAGIGNGLKLDPLPISNTTLPDNGILISGLLATYSATTRGLSQSVVTDVVVDIAKHTITSYAEHSNLTFDAKYQFDATIMFVPVVGKGDISMDLIECNSTVVYQYEREKLGLKLTKAKVILDIKDVKFEITGLKNSQEVTEAIHKLFNENGLSLYEEIRPIAEMDMAKNIEKLYKDIFKEFPAEILNIE